MRGGQLAVLINGDWGLWLGERAVNRETYRDPGRFQHRRVFVGERRRLERGERERGTGGREGYPLHCCVTGNLIEREREGEEKEHAEAGRERERERTYWCTIPGLSCGLWTMPPLLLHWAQFGGKRQEGKGAGVFKESEGANGIDVMSVERVHRRERRRRGDKVRWREFVGAAGIGTLDRTSPSEDAI